MLINTFCMILFINFFSLVSTFEDYELDIYDLVEELNVTFYDFMEVDQVSSTADIRKAYRRLSLLYHPDKNKDEDAETKFRQLVAVYDILKTSEKRQKYDEVLINGLPDWRQPVYYYRKVRKYGFTESALVILITISVIHYAMLWAAFWEKKYEIEEVIKSRLKKNTKRRNNQERNEELMLEMERELNTVRKPSIIQLFPCKVILFIVYIVQQIPHLVTYMKTRTDQEEGLSEVCEVDSPLNKSKVRADGIFAKMAEPEMAEISEPIITSVKQTKENIIRSEDNSTKQESLWTDLDDSKLAQAMQKFPQGTSLRWEKIAQQLNRRPIDVLNRAKGLRVDKVKLPAIQKNNITGVIAKKNDMNVEARGGITIRESEISSLEHVSTQPVSEWTQLQQKSLEQALLSIPKSATDRWQAISDKVPGKNKVECMKRYKYLAEKIKSKKSLEEKD